MIRRVHADKWTESRVDALAETHKTSPLDEEILKEYKDQKMKIDGQKDDDGL